MADAPLIIGVAPNGARLSRHDHPQLPLTPAELAACAADVAREGATLLHLHVRDAAGGHTLDVGRYREALAAIREATADRLILQVTSESCGRYTAAEQRAMVETLEPEAVSLALRELCPDADAEPEAGAFFRALASAGTMAQYIVYSPDDLARFERLRQRGFFGTGHPFVLLVLGRHGSSAAPGATGATGTAGASELAAYLSRVSLAAFPWAACAFGGGELSLVTEAARQGGHARIGFENNRLLADGTVARDNAALVRQLAAALPAVGRRPASVAEARSIMATAA